MAIVIRVVVYLVSADGFVETPLADIMPPIFHHSQMSALSTRVTGQQMHSVPD
jgi:hypothetical protein